MLEIFKKPVNSVFAIHLLLVFLISLGEISRVWAWAILAILAAFIILRPLKESIILFSRSIPFYIALPVTATFDSFNMWRVVTLLIAFKWVFAARPEILAVLNAKFSPAGIKRLWAGNKIEILGLALFAIAFLSLFKAAYFFEGARRLIYFANLAIIFPAIVWVFKKRLVTVRDISKNIAISLFLIVLAGYLQLLSAYVLNLGEFMMFWAGQIQEGFYGKNWSQIVFSANTWFAYNAGTYPKLRMFSTFPDSHTFPLYILMAIPALLTISFEKIKNIKKALVEKFDSEALAWSAFLFLVFLALVLSGTRGIWISIIFPIAFYFLLEKLSKNQKYRVFRLAKNETDQKIIKIAGASLLFFFAAFAASYLVLDKEQFLLRGESYEQRSKLLGRVRSIIDTSETSNSLRIQIWKESLKSVAKNPILGVGIGNFPVVLDKNISTQKEGASAHNLYLNILAETGFASLLAFLAICFLVLKYAWEIFQTTGDKETKIYACAFLLYTLWVFGYNLTDAALFDEREFLMFILAVGIIAGLRKQARLDKPEAKRENAARQQ